MSDSAFQYRVKMFDKFNSSKEEKEFIEGVHLGVFNSKDHVRDFYEGHSILANYYLAKQIEAASKSSDKSSNRMFWLTLVIVAFGAVQIADLVLKLTGVLK